MGQYDLERAATWALIGSPKQDVDTKQDRINNVANGSVHANSEIDYKKVEP